MVTHFHPATATSFPIAIATDICILDENAKKCKCYEEKETYLPKVC